MIYICLLLLFVDSMFILTIWTLCYYLFELYWVS